MAPKELTLSACNFLICYKLSDDGRGNYKTGDREKVSDGALVAEMGKPCMRSVTNKSVLE